MTKRPTPNLTPLVDDASQSPFMRELLEAGRNSSVAGYDFEQGLSKHLALVDAGAPLPHWAEGLRPVAGTGGAASAAAGSSLIAWLAVPLALIAVTSAVVLVSKQSPVVSTPAPVASGAPAPAASARVTTQPAPVVVTPSIAPRTKVQPARVVPRVSHAKRSAPVAMSKPAQAPEVVSVKSAPPSASGDVFATAQPAVAAAPASSTQEPTPAAQPAPKAEAQQAERAPVPPQPAPQDDARLEREMSMLAVAQRALQNDPQRSLSLARQGEAEFSGSMFTQERQQVVLLALVKLGRMEEARRLAKPYLARYPHGPFSDRVRLALATGKVER
jgi:hypothetical protein